MRDTGFEAPKAIIFDLDDTILDDSGSVGPGWRTACAEAEKRVPALKTEALLDAINRVRERFWSDPEGHRIGRLDLPAARLQIVNEALLSLGFRLPAVAEAVAGRYGDLRAAAVRPFPGAVETLEGLRRSGTRLALITNGGGSGQRAKIERLDLARQFDYVLIEGEFGCGKPDRRVYASAMQALRSEAGETWSVGDNLEWDIAAPQRLGLYTVWLDRFNAGLPADASVQPDRVVGAIRELLPA